MVIKVQNETPFQVLSDSFTIGPSETGYELQVGATSQDFSTLFSVGANTPRMVTNVANGSYYRLKGNSGEVSVNWQRTCKGGGGEGGSNTELDPVMDFPVAPAAGTVVAYAGSSSAAGVYQYDGTDWVPVGGDTEEIELPIAAAVNVLKDNMEARLDQQYYKKQEVNNLLNEKVTAGQVNEQIKDYTDPAIAEVYDTIEDKELPVSAALNELNDRINGMSGGTGGDMDRLVPVSGLPVSAETGTLVGKVDTDAPGYWTDGEDYEKIFHPNTAWTGTTPLTIASGNYYNETRTIPFDIKVYYDAQGIFCDGLIYRSYDVYGGFNETCLQDPVIQVDYQADEEGNYFYKEEVQDIEGEYCLVVWKEDGEGTPIENDMTFTDPIVQTLHTYQFDGENWVPYATAPDTKAMVDDKIYKGNVIRGFNGEEELQPYLNAARLDTPIYFVLIPDTYYWLVGENSYSYFTGDTIYFAAVKAPIEENDYAGLQYKNVCQLFAPGTEPEEPEPGVSTDIFVSYDGSAEEGERFAAWINDEQVEGLVESGATVEIPVKYWNTYPNPHYVNGHLMAYVENGYLYIGTNIWYEGGSTPSSIKKEDFEGMANGTLFKVMLPQGVYGGMLSYENPNRSYLMLVDKLVSQTQIEDKVSSSSISNIWKGTQAQYDTLTQSGATADPNTFYIIINN